MRPPTAERPVLRLIQGAAAERTPEPDPRDFEAVFRCYAPYVARIGLRLLGSESELDDLVQEVFMEAHRGLCSLREPGALRAWLSRICVRRATRRLRQRRLRAFLSLDSVTDAELPRAHGASPELAAEVSALYRRLSQLSSGERVVWVLKHVEGESLDDIAFLCSCSKSTVQRRLRNAEAYFDREATP